MKLADLLPKLVKNDTFNIVIADEENRNIITLNPTGFGALSSELTDRDVEEVSITTDIIKIFLETVEETGDPTGGD